MRYTMRAIDNQFVEHENRTWLKKLKEQNPAFKGCPIRQSPWHPKSYIVLGRIYPASCVNANDFHRYNDQEDEKLRHVECYSITWIDRKGKVTKQEHGVSQAEYEQLAPFTGPGGRYFHLTAHTDKLMKRLTQASRMPARRRKKAFTTPRVSDPVKNRLRAKIEADRDIHCETR